MKVLLVTAMWPTPRNPAFGSFIASQAAQLRKAGMDVSVMVLDGRFRKLIYPKGVLQLRWLLSREPADVVHAHYGYVGAVARTQWQVPVVVTYHGDDVQGTIGKDGRKTLFSRAAASFCCAVGRFADAIIVQNQDMARRFEGANVHIIPHEVDLDLFRPAAKSEARRQLGLRGELAYLLFAASPGIPVKRFPLAQAAFDRLRVSHPAAELLVVSRETQDRLALYMSACDALVFPSYQEGSPNIVKQAMACNLPIVATDVGDVREVIGSTAGCYICRADADEFAARLREILRNPARTSGREKVQRFSGPLVAKRVIEVYEGVLPKRANAKHAMATQE